MKRFILITAVFLLLTGCAAEPVAMESTSPPIPETTAAPETTVSAVETTVPETTEGA